MPCLNVSADAEADTDSGTCWSVSLVLRCTHSLWFCPSVTNSRFKSAFAFGYFVSIKFSTASDMSSPIVGASFSPSDSNHKQWRRSFRCTTLGIQTGARPGESSVFCSHLVWGRGRLGLCLWLFFLLFSFGSGASKHLTEIIQLAHTHINYLLTICLYCLMTICFFIIKSSRIDIKESFIQRIL